MVDGILFQTSIKKAVQGMENQIAETAKQVSYTFECKKDALRQNQNGGVKVSFTIHPHDMPDELYKDQMGQRYLIVAVPLNDDESPRIPDHASSGVATKTPVRPPEGVDKGKNYTAASKLLSKNASFQKYLENLLGEDVTEERAEQYIEGKCGVTSCKDIKEKTSAGDEFARIYATFMDWERFQ
jgi:hypothetical protein